jgi:hypothetical protein
MRRRVGQRQALSAGRTANRAANADAAQSVAVDWSESFRSKLHSAWTYTPDGAIASITAQNGVTRNQTTT